MTTGTTIPNATEEVTTDFWVFLMSPRISALSHVIPVGGKIDKMEGHAHHSQNLSPERFGSHLHQEILDELAQPKSNKENTPVST